jgi:diguanylate cyclase (GGDEF)-like protein
MQDSRMLNVLDMMQNYIENHYDSYGIASATTRTITDIMDWDHVALVLNNPEKHGWTVVKSQTKSSSIPYVTEGSGVDLERSVLRKVIDDMDGLILDAPTAPAFRFHEKEAIESKGQICAVPLATPHKCYGLIAVEYREAHQYAQKDLDILTRIAAHAANALEIVSLRELTGKHLLIDEIAHVPSRGYLAQRLDEETSRISDQGGQGVFFLVAIDGPDDIIAKHGEAAIDTVVFHLGKLLPEHVKPFDFIGRADGSRFGIFMINSGADDAYLRGEKIRKAVTSLPIQFGGLTFSVSVSVAGCVVHQGMGSDAVMSLVQQVHDRAVSDGGNCVKIV